MLILFKVRGDPTNNFYEQEQLKLIYPLSIKQQQVSVTAISGSVGNRQMSGSYSDDGEAGLSETASVNGSSMEVVGNGYATGRGELGRRNTLSHRDQVALQARNGIWEDIANKLLPPEESELMIQYLERGADESTKRTHVESATLPHVDEGAAVSLVGLTFLPGADKSKLTRLEQSNMAGGEPDQKDAKWRGITAASLLKQFEVSTDLSIVQRYRTDEITAIAPTHAKGSKAEGSHLKYVKIKRGLSGFVNGTRVSAIADTGSAQNVISAAYASDMKLLIDSKSSFFKLGNSKTILSIGELKI